MELVAKKPFRYRHRMLAAGDRFSAPATHGRILIAVRSAGKAPKEVPASPVSRKTASTPPTLSMPTPAAALDRDPLDHDNDGRKGGSQAAEPVEDLPALRAEYQRVTGKRPFSAWRADELRRRMAAHEDDGEK